MQAPLIIPAKQDPEDRVDRAPAWGARAAWLKLAVWFGVVLLTGAIGCAQSASTPDPSSIEYGESFSEVSPFARERDRRIAAEQQKGFRMRVAIPDAVGDDVEDVLAASRDTGQKRKIMATAPPPPDSTPSLLSSVLLLAAWFLLVVLLAIRKFASEPLNKLNDKIQARISRLASAPRGPENVCEKHRTEEEGVTAFFTAFTAGPAVGPNNTALMPRSPGFGSPSEARQNSCPAGRIGAVKEFQAGAAKLLITQRSLLQEINRAADEVGRQKMLAALRWEMHALKGEAGLPWLLPIWQVASALEGLLMQLTDKFGNVTSSTLRTVADGVDLLDDLCRSALDPSLLTARPIKLLVVDNNSISRDAIACALKRAFNPPDLADDVETALALTTSQGYDVIFLDAQMPGADGFEFCFKIHETDSNRNTSVVFVTDQDNFDLCAPSILCGGSDLIGKPFLTFEIILKALTSALRARLPASAHAADAGCEADDSNGLTPALVN